MGKRKTNSCQKGKRGERAAAAYLESLGFPGGKRTRQSKGSDDPDVRLHLPGFERLQIEVKYLYNKKHSFEVGTKSWKEACFKAAKDCGGQRWIILFRSPRQTQWKMTLDNLYTLGFDNEISVALDMIRNTLAAADEESLRP